MRHRVKLNHLGRKSAHRKALLSHLASDLIKNKRIITTLAKAKALRVYVEPLITKSKSNTTHQRRTVFSYLQDKEAVTELFGEVSAKIGSRAGGYTRIIKLGARYGDAAEMALIELVDYNEIYSNEPAVSGKKKRTRRGGSRAKEAGVAPAKAESKEKEAAAPVAEPKAEKEAKAGEKKEEQSEKKAEAKAEEKKKDKAEAKAEEKKEDKAEAKVEKSKEVKADAKADQAEAKAEEKKADKKDEKGSADQKEQDK